MVQFPKNMMVNGDIGAETSSSMCLDYLLCSARPFLTAIHISMRHFFSLVSTLYYLWTRTGLKSLLCKPLITIFSLFSYIELLARIMSLRYSSDTLQEFCISPKQFATYFYIGAGYVVISRTSSAYISSDLARCTAVKNP